MSVKSKEGGGMDTSDTSQSLDGWMEEQAVRSCSVSPWLDTLIVLRNEVQVFGSLKKIVC